MIASKSVLGMWVFLASEMLFFGGLFVAFGVNFFLHPQAFIIGIQHMNLALGSLNTALLLTSSGCLAWALHTANRQRPRQVLILFFATAFMGLLFLIIKFSEYASHAREHLVPALDWHPAFNFPKATEIFFFMYFFMTLLHALHLLIGIILIGIFGWRYSLAGDHEKLLPSFENLGLYWHFVDVIWIILFPCLYLFGRT